MQLAQRALPRFLSAANSPAARALLDTGIRPAAKSYTLDTHARISSYSYHQVVFIFRLCQLLLYITDAVPLELYCVHA